MQTTPQINIVVPNVPSSLAKVCDKLRASNVNIVAIACTEREDTTIIHMIVNDPETAKIVLRDLGEVSTTDVLEFVLKNKPGAIATLGRACAIAGVNIRNIYATTHGKDAAVYVSVDDVARAIDSLRQWENTNGKSV